MSWLNKKVLKKVTKKIVEVITEQQTVEIKIRIFTNKMAMKFNMPPIIKRSEKQPTFKRNKKEVVKKLAALKKNKKKTNAQPIKMDADKDREQTFTLEKKHISMLSETAVNKTAALVESKVSAKPNTAPAEPKVSVKPNAAPAESKVSAKPNTAPAEPKVSAKPNAAPAEPKVSAKPNAAPAESKVSAKPNAAPAESKVSAKPNTAPAESKVSAKPTAAPAEPKVSAKPNAAPAEPKVSAKPNTAPAEPKKVSLKQAESVAANVVSKPLVPINKDDNHICVISGKEYCIKIIALYRSLMKQSNHVHLWVLCTDDFTYQTLSKMALKHVHLLHVEEIENEKLQQVKTERKTNEYCWTLKAPLVEFILSNYDIERILYCDGDIYFFQDPAAIFQNWGESSIYLCPQRDLAWVEEKYGKYQAGIIGFKKDTSGLAAVKWWKDRCIEWCSSIEDNGRFGDQKYLDQLPILFGNTKVSNHLGINAAPWNCIYNNNFQITKNENQVYIQKDSLIAYHFSCLTIYDRDKFDLWNMHPLTIQKEIVQYIYQPYLQHLQATIAALEPSYPELLTYTLSAKPFIEAKTAYYDTPLRREIDQYDQFMHFATIFSKEYLIKGLALYDSLKKQMNNFHMWICTMDEETHQLLTKKKLENVTLIRVSQIETPALALLKNERTLQEYCWTIKGVLIDYILTNFSEINHIFYCDSDLYFFSDPTLIFKEWQRYSIFLCRQRGSAELEYVHGQYQAGFIGFKNDKNSRKILNWWKTKCIEQCFNEFNAEKNTWGDQKYLDRIPELFQNIKVSSHPGINAAPWNVVMHHKNQLIEQKNSQLFIDNQPLVFFHFGSLLIKTETEYDLWKLETLQFTKPVLAMIYHPYLHQLKEVAESIKLLDDSQDISSFFAPIPLNHPLKNPYFLK